MKSSLPVRLQDALVLILALVTLAPCLVYPFAAGYGGGPLALRDDVVVADEPCPGDPGRCLLLHDRILRLGGVPIAELLADRWRTLESVVPAGVPVPIEVVRDGRVMNVLYTRDARVQPQFVLLLFATLTFWLAGTVAALVFRPRNTLWLLTVLFFYDIAVWICAGAAGHWRSYGAAVTFHAVIWLFLPLTAHLHLLLTNPWERSIWRRALLVTLYGGATVISMLDHLRLVEPLARRTGVYALVTVILAIALIVAGGMRDPSPSRWFGRRALLFGLGLGLGPLAVVASLALFIASGAPAIPGLAIRAAFLCLPLLPMSYLYVVRQGDIPRLEIRANRLLGHYAFFALLLLATLVTLVVTFRWSNLELPAPVVIAAVVFCVATAGAVQPVRVRFLGWIDRAIFGIPHPVAEVAGIASRRLPTAVDREGLATMIEQEILSTLLVRESALLLSSPGGPEIVLATGLDGAALDAAKAWLDRDARELRAPAVPRDLPGSPPAWIRLAIPLAVRERVVGVWLFGRRDPDDAYPAEDVRQLATVAAQAARMLENIRLFDEAQAEVAFRRQAEEEIGRRERHFRELFEAALEGVAIVRGERIVEINQTLALLLGREASQVEGRALSDFLAHVQEAGGRPGLFETSLLRGDGSTIEVEVAVRRYQLGGEESRICAIRDITERRRRESAYQELQRELATAQKLEAVGRFSAGIAHDFNNCLQAILGYDQILLDRYAGVPLLEQNLRGIRDTAQKAAGLTRQLLSFTRQQPREARPLDLNAVVSGLEALLRRLLREDVQMVSELDPRLGMVNVDPVQIEQVIVNLAINAADAMPSGGRFTIQTFPASVLADDPAIDRGVPPGEYALLAVSDTGSGMDGETMARAFEPFFTTKSGGSGLGLSIVYGIVHQNHGHIVVDSAIGRGTQFLIYLPVVAPGSAAPRIEAQGSVERGWESVLLVEDNEHVRASLAQTLAALGYAVTSAGSGEEALAICADAADLPHALVTDVRMPGMTGVDLASHLTARRPELCVVFMSGYTEVDFSETSAASSVWLQKPFRPELLAGTLRSLLDRVKS